MMSLEECREAISRCVHCGACRGVCPTFDAIRREAASARGKVSLADAYLKGDIRLSDTLLKHISECLLCGACQEICANDVPVPDIVMALRAESVKIRGLPVVTSLIMKGMERHGNIMAGGLKLASIVQGFFFRKTADGGGLQRRFPLPIIQGERLVPPLARRFFMDAVKEEGLLEDVERPQDNEGRGMGNKRVGFFAGCLINYLMPEIGIASLKVLKRCGAVVAVPMAQTCCGMPALGMGDVEDARSLALRNIKAFEGDNLDYITTACATCSRALKRVFRELFKDERDDIKERVEAFSSRVRDITDLLVNLFGFKGLGVENKKLVDRPQVAYHDPCHLKRGLGISREPREIIEVSGMKCKEMKEPSRCCGLGGSFNITNYDLSMDINKRKTDDIKETGADMVATACPGCIVQLRDGLNRAGLNIEVRHVVELLYDRVEGLQ